MCLIQNGLHLVSCHVLNIGRRHLHAVCGYACRPPVEGWMAYYFKQSMYVLIIHNASISWAQIILLYREHLRAF